MHKSIIGVYILVIIYKILNTSVIWRIYINDIDLALMRLFQQTQAMEIIALKEKVIDFTCGTGDFSVRVFFEDGYMGTHFNIHGFFVLFPDETVLLGVQFALDLAEGDGAFSGKLRIYASVESKNCRLAFAIPSAEDEYEIIFKLFAEEGTPAKLNVKPPPPPPPEKKAEEEKKPDGENKDENKSDDGKKDENKEEKPAE